MPHFNVSIYIQAPVEAVFAFHELPDAIERLTPTTQDIRVIEKSGGIASGSFAKFSLPLLGPWRITWHAVHTAYEPNRLFVDEQQSGPFAYWRHEHRFRSQGTGSVLEDDIEFRLPGGPIVNFFGAPFVRLQLQQLFKYRHQVTKLACEPQ